MVVSLMQFWHRVRRSVSRTEWLIRLLGRPGKADGDERPGLIMVQVDGLSHRQLERALESRRMPFLNDLLRAQGYRVHRMYSGLPSSTPGAQGELFYGVPTAVPAFSFFDESFGRVVRMYDTDVAEAVEAELMRQGEPLLKGGTAYMDVYTGGAEESHFCAPGLRPARMLAGPGSAAFIWTMILNPVSLLRVTAVFGLEILLALFDCARGIIAGRDLWKELRFVPMRVGICALSRELITIGARMDVVRGFPIVHLNLLGYDEQAHRRGPSSAFAHWTLRGIDDAIERIWRTAQRSSRRNYGLCIYSDHGQEDTVPFPRITGRSIQAAVRSVFNDTTGKVPDPPAESHGIQSQRLRALGREKSDASPTDRVSVGDSTEPIVTALGPLGHVYWPYELGSSESRRVSEALVSKAQVPLVLFMDGYKQVRARSPEGDFLLPAEAAQVLGPEHPHLGEVTRDLMALCRHSKSGTFVLSGWRRHDKSITFPIESGGHAGPGPEETTGFVLLPGDALIPATGGKRLRPIHLRKTALAMLGRRSNDEVVAESSKRRRAVRLLTYNVHSCIGMDGRLSPQRVAYVIAQSDPDIVALQELDMHRTRTRSEDQASVIARLLCMEHHFHPSFQLAGECFGNAVLTRLPMRLVKAGELPGLPDARRREARAAIWVEIDTNGTKLQVLNTHLGLNRRERLAQVRAMLGHDWYANSRCRFPLVVCGDLNALPTSPVYQKLVRPLCDAQRTVDGWRPRATWPARWPVARIDHVLVSPDLKVVEVHVPYDNLACVASDHRPLVVALEMPYHTGG